MRGSAGFMMLHYEDDSGPMRVFSWQPDFAQQDSDELMGCACAWEARPFWTAFVGLFARLPIIRDQAGHVPRDVE